MSARAINGAGEVRFGTIGSLSAANSPIASRENIATAVVDPMNANGESWRFKQFHNSNPKSQKEDVGHGNWFLFWLAPKISAVQRHENDHGEIDPAAPVDLRSRQA